jgi:hypothetical protein
MKLLRHGADHKRYRRFRDEISTHTSLNSTPGILPVLDHHLPEQPSASDRAWLLTEIAERVTDLFVIEERIDLLPVDYLVHVNELTGKSDAWERQPGEPNRWFERFDAYRLAGPARSLLGSVNAERLARGAAKGR